MVVVVLVLGLLLLVAWVGRSGLEAEGLALLLPSGGAGVAGGGCGCGWLLGWCC